jgi:hypothetical protein
VIANAARLQGLYTHATDLLEQRGLYAAELIAEQVNVLWLVQILRAVGGSLQGVLYGSLEISGHECVFYLNPRFDSRYKLWSGRSRSPGDRAE